MESQTLTLNDAARRILEEKNISITDTEVLNEMIDDVVESISNRIHARMIESLGRAEKKELDQLIEQKATPEEVQEFFSANVRNIPDIITSSILEVRNIYLSQ